MRLVKTIALVAACLTQLEIMTAQCRTACLWAGYDEGFYKDQKCWCVDIKDYYQMTGTKRIVIGSKRKAPDDR